MASIINADTSDGLKITSDTSGQLDFQSAGVSKGGLNSTGWTGDGSQLTGVTGVGKVLQVVKASTTTQRSSGSTSFVDTNISGSITPTYTSSKILVLVSQNVSIASDTASHREVQIKLLRDTTQLLIRMNEHQTSSSARSWATFAADISYLDSPSTTSATTYKTQMKLNGTSANIYAQRDGFESTITLVEIAG